MNTTPRECGDCSLCCKVMRIPELEKPKDEWCPNFVRGRGCGIYADRPDSCRTFNCQWVTDLSMGPEWKPSVCKMVLVSKPRLLAVHVDPAANKPWRLEPYYSTLKRLSAQAQKMQGVVLVIDRKRNIVILPDRDEDLGYVDPDARIAFEQVNTNEGPQWRLRIMGAAEQSEPR